MSNDKERLDILLVECGFANSRENAKRLIMAGQVLVDECRVEKAGTAVTRTANIRILGDDIPYVSRGGLKLEKALSLFPVVLDGKVAMDIGASTGGFTDCMLKHGAKKVYAVDVGYGQLDWRLRTDSRVVNMERTNIRYLKPEDIDSPVDFISIDVAFISLTKVLPAAIALLQHNGEIISLIKPQFEAGRENVGKNGIVRDANIHETVIKDIISFVYDIDLMPVGLTYSPIKGPKGNIEYLLYLKFNNARENDNMEWELLTINSEIIKATVNEAHQQLK